MYVLLGQLGGGRTSIRRVLCGVCRLLLLSMLLPVVMLVDGLDPDGHRGKCPRARYRQGWRQPDSWASKVRRADGSRCFGARLGVRVVCSVAGWSHR